MQHSRPNRRGYGPGLLMLTLIGWWLTLPAQATTLQRASVEKLATTNSDVVIGEVVETKSYWNHDGTLILTDVVIETQAQLKGRRTKEARRTVTVLGGTVDDLTTVIISGPRLEVGQSYVLFTSRMDLPGHTAAMTIPDHAQGVFDLVDGDDGSLRAISQAAEAHLMADSRGVKSAPGGAEGMALDQLLAVITRAGDEQGVSR